MLPGDPPATSTELDDVVVVEVGSGISGAFAARILGDLGASVTKVEPPGGDPLRDPAAPGGVDGTLFEYLNWNKSSVVLDLTDPAGRDRLRELVAATDVVVTSLDPPVARSLGLTVDEMRAWNPSAVVTSVTSFGADGPYADDAASELVLQAMGGVMAVSGTTAGGPLKRGLRQSTFYGGLNTAYATLAGIYSARASGEGVAIDLSLRECVAAELIMNQSLYTFLGVLQSRQADRPDPLGGFPVACADGFVTVQPTSGVPMPKLAEYFGEPALADPKFASKEGRTEHALELEALVLPKLAEIHARDFFVDASHKGYLVGFVQDATRMLECDQLAARHAFWSFPEVTVRDGEAVRFPAGLGRMSGWPERHPAHHAPALGEGRGAKSVPSRTSGGEPLSGLKVLDFSQVFAGPYIGGLLADFGADVIKIESPYRLDQARTDYGGYFDNDPGDDPWNRTSTFQVINRGKSGISLDLKNEEGKEIFRRLVADADVVIENFTPHVLPSWGLGYDALSAINPRLILLSNSGFGSNGPWTDFKAQGTTLEATMGVLTYTGYRGGPPTKAGQSYPDFIATWTGLTMLFAALVGRQRTGVGQWIDMGMYDIGMSVFPEALLHLQAEGAELERMGNDDFGVLASGVVRCAGADEWLAYSAPTVDALARLAAVVVGGVLDPSEAEEAVAAWAATRGAESAARALQDAGVAAGKVLDARDLLFDPQMLHRGFYEIVDDIRGAGSRPIIGRPFRWRGGGTDVRARGRAPRFAEHTDAVLHDRAGYSDEQVADAVASGAVARGPISPIKASPGKYDAMVANGSLKAVGGDFAEVVDKAMTSLRAAGDADGRVHAGVGVQEEGGGR